MPTGERALLKYKMPLAEIATEFHDRVKNLSSGFASMDYEEAGMQVRPGVARSTAALPQSCAPVKHQPWLHMRREASCCREASCARL